MLIHEYQAKELFRKYGIPVSSGAVALIPESVEEAVNSLDSEKLTIKAQVHAGGRGKAGGIKLAKSANEAVQFATEMFGKTLVTKQTGAKGKIVRRVYIEVSSYIAKEYYLGIVVDRKACAPVVMCSSEGGVDIEEVASKSPEKIHKEWAEPAIGLQPFQARRLAFKLGIPSALISLFSNIVMNSYHLFVEKDCSLLEINPLILTPENHLRALDAKINFDNNALYRHAGISQMRDIDEEDPIEVRAGEFGLSYVNLDGNIGCLVNGAGLAMATMDIIKHYGGTPANFLDVGGSASKEAVTEAFRLILADERVKGILVNIFGGIMKCDTIAQGIISAAKEIGIKVPLVVRLEGTNVEIGMKMLVESGLAITTAKTMSEGAEKIVKLTSGSKG